MDEFALFAKFWEPGAVKTRLATDIGDAAAAEIHRLSLLTLLRRFAASGDRRVLAYSPLAREQTFREVAGSAWELRAQSPGGLGHRIVAHFAAAAARQARRAVLIGSDSPTLPSVLVAGAFEALQNRDVVIGPSEDGGFYLIGVRVDKVPTNLLDSWLRDIPWSTAQVWPLLHRTLQRDKVAYQTLDTWYDVDTVADLHRLRAELSMLAPQDPNWQPLAEAIRAALPLTH